jgi:hypothetical protein
MPDPVLLFLSVKKQNAKKIDLTPNFPKNKKPHLFFKKWGSKSPYHTFPPSKGIGELISEGMITERKRKSISKSAQNHG